MRIRICGIVCAKFPLLCGLLVLGLATDGMLHAYSDDWPTGGTPCIERHGTATNANTPAKLDRPLSLERWEA